ncbi:MAG: MBL fold metallo-hydrolase [Candidatus Poribacteria bacterium]|nr:MBL fold metallo-hydrolase [Candidatus Poribacteria bacterium]
MRNITENPFAPRQYGQLVKVTERVYLFRNIVNSSIIIGDNGVAVIDTQVNQMMARRLYNAIRTVTDKPILYAINTHYHWDHTNGNTIFHQAGATVVAREMTKEFMVNRSPRQEAFLRSRGFTLGDPPFLPQQTFAHETELDLGNQPLHLVHLGKAETDDATAVRIPAENCIVSGDTVMTGSFPIFGQPVMNEGLMANHDWINTINELRTYAPKCVLPGHGPLAQDAEIDLLLQIESYFLTEVRKRLEQGMSLAELIADMETNFPEWIRSIAEVWGTPRYAILRVYRGLIDDPEPGWQHLKPSAIPAAGTQKLHEKTHELEEFEAYRETAEEVAEGNDFGLAIAILKTATEKFSNLPDAWTAYANLVTQASRTVSSVLEKGDFFVEAKKALNTALELDPDYAPAHLLRGYNHILSAYRNGDETKTGLASIYQALVNGLQGTQLAQAYFSIGLAHRTNGDETLAREAFAKAIAADARFMPAQLANMA